MRGGAQATSRQIAHEVAKVETESRSRDAKAEWKQEIENKILGFFYLTLDTRYIYNIEKYFVMDTLFKDRGRFSNYEYSVVNV